MGTGWNRDKYLFASPSDQKEQTLWQHSTVCSTNHRLRLNFPLDFIGTILIIPECWQLLKDYSDSYTTSQKVIQTVVYSLSQSKEQRACQRSLVDPYHSSFFRGVGRCDGWLSRWWQISSDWSLSDPFSCLFLFCLTTFRQSRIEGLSNLHQKPKEHHGNQSRTLHAILTIHAAPLFLEIHSFSSNFFFLSLFISAVYPKEEPHCGLPIPLQR